MTCPDSRHGQEPEGYKDIRAHGGVPMGPVACVSQSPAHSLQHTAGLLFVK